MKFFLQLSNEFRQVKHNDRRQGQLLSAILKHTDIATMKMNKNVNLKTIYLASTLHTFSGSSQGSPFASTQPEFILEQLKISGKFCLVIDVSGSMAVISYYNKEKETV